MTVITMTTMQAQKKPDWELNRDATMQAVVDMMASPEQMEASKNIYDNIQAQIDREAPVQAKTPKKPDWELDRDATMQAVIDWTPEKLEAGKSVYYNSQAQVDRAASMQARDPKKPDWELDRVAKNVYYMNQGPKTPDWELNRNATMQAIVDMMASPEQLEASKNVYDNIQYQAQIDRAAPMQARTPKKKPDWELDRDATIQAVIDCTPEQLEASKNVRYINQPQVDRAAPIQARTSKKPDWELNRDATIQAVIDGTLEKLEAGKNIYHLHNIQARVDRLAPMQAREPKKPDWELDRDATIQKTLEDLSFPEKDSVDMWKRGISDCSTHIDESTDIWKRDVSSDSGTESDEDSLRIH